MEIYITEGIDGSGKSTASRFIAETFSVPDNLRFREPDGYSRQILAKAAADKDKKDGIKMSVLDEWMCFWLYRFDLWMNHILPQVNEKKTLIIDRSFVSTYAYQIYGRDLGPEFEKSFFFWKSRLLELFTGKDVHIHHVYMRASVKVAQARIGFRGIKDGDLTQFEEGNMQMRVKSGFDLYYHEGKNLSPIEDLIVIDADKDIDEVQAELRDKLVIT